MALLNMDPVTWAEARGITVCELVSPRVVFPRGMADDRVDPIMVGNQGHFEQDGVVVLRERVPLPFGEGQGY